MTVDWRVRLTLLAAIWGTSYLLIKVAVPELTPVEITLGRCACGLLVVVPLLVAARRGLPRTPALWGHLFVAALVLNTVPFTLFGYAEQHVSSAVAGVANGSTPLFTVLFALTALREERPTTRSLAGLVLGMAGVATVLQPWQGLRADTTGVLMAVLASACYALGWVYLRRFVRDTGHSPLVLTAGQLVCATVQTAVLWPITSDGPPTPSTGTVLAVVALGALGTGVAYVLQHGVIAEAGATAASTVSYLVPVFAVLAGVLVLGERLGWPVLVGGVLVLAGAALVQRRTAARAMSSAGGHGPPSVQRR